MSKNGLFWCISTHYAPKVRNPDKTLHFLKRLICVFLSYFMKKTIYVENFVYSSHFTLLCHKTKKLMKTSQQRENKVEEKKVLFQQVSAFFCGKTQKCRRNTLFVELTDICKKRVVLLYFSILYTKTERYRENTTYVKTSFFL